MSDTIRNFSVEQVQDWLYNNGFSKHMEVFASCEVNGEFLMEMTETELTSDLGFTSYEAQQLMSKVKSYNSVPSYGGAAAAAAAVPYTPSAAAMGLTAPVAVSPTAAYTPSPTGGTRSLSPTAPPTQSQPYVPSAAASCPLVDPQRVQQLERENAQLRQENDTLRAETSRLSGELQNMKTMYDQLLQQQKSGAAAAPPMVTAVTPYQPTPAAAAPPAPQYQAVTGYQPQPPQAQPVVDYSQQQQQQVTAYAAQPAAPTYAQQPPPAQYQQQPPPQQQQYQQPPPDQQYQQAQQGYAQAPAPPSKNDAMKQTGVNVVKGAGLGALGGATMGAVAGAILPNMDASDGAKAGAAMGALGGGLQGLTKGKKLGQMF